MIVSIIREWALFRTHFNDKYDIVHQFTNMIGESIERNGQIDFLCSGLIEKDNPRSWDTTIKLSSSSDEAAPIIVNGSWIGGGHGQPCGVTVYAPLHSKTNKDDCKDKKLQTTDRISVKNSEEAKNGKRLIDKIKMD